MTNIEIHYLLYNDLFLYNDVYNSFPTSWANYGEIKENSYNCQFLFFLVISKI